jgi:hypothetical protein
MGRARLWARERWKAEAAMIGLLFVVSGTLLVAGWLWQMYADHVVEAGRTVTSEAKHVGRLATVAAVTVAVLVSGRSVGESVWNWVDSMVEGVPAPLVATAVLPPQVVPPVSQAVVRLERPAPTEVEMLQTSLQMAFTEYRKLCQIRLWQSSLSAIQKYDLCNAEAMRGCRAKYSRDTCAAAAVAAE